MGVHDDILKSLQIKLQQLSGKMESQEGLLQKAETEIEGLKSQLRLKNEELDVLQDQLRKMKLAKTLGGDSEQKREARQMIQTMLREVDKCIALLNR